MAVATIQTEAAISNLVVEAFQIPTERPESDGTLAWDATTLVTVHVTAEDVTGFGYTYADASAAAFIQSKLVDAVIGQNPFDIPRVWRRMRERVRNEGQCGIAYMAISAVDAALWDLKAKLLDLPLVSLLGAQRERVSVYGSGGFTSADDASLAEQLAGWVEREGVGAVKMKVGRDPERDRQRVKIAREAIGDDCQLMVDANSAYLSPQQALQCIEEFKTIAGICWMEQPLDPDDLAGLRFLRERGAIGVEVVDGEYGYTLADFRRYIDAGAVDVVMADATRCGGVTGLLKVDALCEAASLPLSTHCAPSLHAHPSCSMTCVRNCEYFCDHARIESMLFDGFQAASGGAIRPDTSRPGVGVELKRSDASRYAL